MQRENFLLYKNSENDKSAKYHPMQSSIFFHHKKPTLSKSVIVVSPTLRDIYKIIFVESFLVNSGLYFIRFFEDDLMNDRLG